MRLDYTESTKDRVIIIGACSTGKVVLDTLNQSMNENQFEVVGFVDDNKGLYNKNLSGIPVIGDIISLPILIKEFGITGAFVSFSDLYMKEREKCFNTIKGLGLCPVNAIHPTANINPNASIGSGTFIGMGVIISSFVNIGNNCMIFAGSTIEHDNVIGNNVWISPGVNLSGKVTIGNNTLIGTGATINPNIKIGSNVTIGSGAVVIKDIPDDVVVVGIPGRIIKEKL